MHLLVEIFLFCVLFGVVLGKGPLKLYTKGYNRRNLPADGGWTRWFNTYFGHGMGDHEHIYDVYRLYGRGCDGMPCRKPLAMKIISANWLTPEEEGDRIVAHPRRGMRCVNNHQLYRRKCADYMVRYYCANMRETCRRKHKEEIKQKYENSPIKPEKKWNDVNKGERDLFIQGIKRNQS